MARDHYQGEVNLWAAPQGSGCRGTRRYLLALVPDLIGKFLDLLSDIWKSMAGIQFQEGTDVTAGKMDEFGMPTIALRSYLKGTGRVYVTPPLE